MARPGRTSKARGESRTRRRCGTQTQTASFRGLSLGTVLERLESRAMLAADVASVAPTLDAIADITIDEDASEQTVFLQGISAGSGESQPLRVTASSSDASVLPDPTVSYTSPKSFGVMTFTPVADASGTVTVTVQVEDGGDDGDLATSGDNQTTTQAFDVTVLAINDLPVLDPSAALTLGTVTEDAPPPTGAVGVLVSTLVDTDAALSNFQDADGDAPGVAVVGANLDGGTLWSSQDGGNTWTQASGVSEASPLLLVADASTRLYFQPAAAWTGSISDVITVRGWDQGTSWQQVGNTLAGAAAQDYAGRAVAMSADGQIVAIGATGNDAAGDGAGVVMVSRYDAATGVWQPMGAGIAGVAASDAAGTAVSMSSDGLTIAVGAPANDDGGRDAGQVRVYNWNASLESWVQVGEPINGEASLDRAGSAVSLSGDATTLAIGAFGNDEVGPDAGHARIFRWNAGAGAWQQLGGDINGLAEGNGAGTSVSLASDGNVVAVGEPRSGAARGQVRVFSWNANTSAWDLVGAAVAGEANADNFGGSVSLSADGLTMAVGGPGNAGNGFGAGHVRVYSFDSGSSQWVQQGQDLDGEAMFDNAGVSVALSADASVVVVGADKNAGPGVNGAGHARVYRWDATGEAWVRLNADIDGEAADNSAGMSVAVSASGNFVAVGAIGSSDAGFQSGQVRVFESRATLSDASDVVSVEVLRYNRQPTLDAISNITVDLSDGEQTVALAGITAGSGDSQPLRVTVTSSDQAVVGQPDVVYASPDTDGTVRLVPLLAGSATITVTVEDGGLDGNLSTAADNGSVERSFTFTVTDNSVDPPTFDSVMTFTSNGYWVLNTSNGTSFTQTTYAAWAINDRVDWTSVVEGDFNGDGLMDVAGRTTIGQWWASLNNGNGTGGDGLGGTAPVLMTYWRPTLGIENIVTGDFNGDGATDVAGMASNGAWWVGFAKTGGEVGFTNLRVGGWLTSFTFRSIQTGDFNGDGNTDIAGLATTGQWFGLFGQEGRGWTSEVLGFWSPTLNFTDDIVAADFNGDGRTDIAGRSAANVWYVATANTDTIGLTTTVLGVWGNTTWSSTTVGDFNGDGQAEILARAANGQWWGLVSDGTSGTRTNTLVGYWNPNVIWTGIIAGDADGDGRDELLGRRATSAELARGALWVANVTEGLMRANRWGFQNVAADVEARNLFFSKY